MRFYLFSHIALSPERLECGGLLFYQRSAPLERK